MLPLVALDRMFRLQVSEPPQTKMIEHPGHGGEGSGQQPGDVPEVEALVTEIHGLLQLLRNQSQPASLPQAGISAYAWGVRSPLGGDTSTGSDLTLHWLLNNLLNKNS
jgi:hypothetical protein